MKWLKSIKPKGVNQSSLYPEIEAQSACTVRTYFVLPLKSN